MRRFLAACGLIGFCFLLQSTVFQAISFGGIVPNLLMILTASSGFIRGEKSGLLYGFFCGLLADIFFGSFLGFYALVYMYIGYLNGKLNPVFFPEDIKLPLFMIFISDLSYGLFCYVIMFLVRGRFHFTYYFVHIIIPEIVYTLIATLFLYPLILWINSKLSGIEQRSARKFV